ncbi:MAG: cytochrome c oxidase assembly factor 1 family protein [Planctomycetaceae bacterium]|nr:cytochrome c oxidase assembly factor 1 family protein [Planctomycetaceae bacterium]
MSGDFNSTESTGRKWWLIPVGCFGAIVLCCGLPLVLVPIVFGAIKSSTPYQESLARVQASPEVQAVIGQPIEPAFWVNGNIEVNGPNGKASLSYAVSGPQGTATVTLDADKVVDRWTFNVLKVVQAGEGDAIDLLAEDDGSDGPASDVAPIENDETDE